MATCSSRLAAACAISLLAACQSGAQFEPGGAHSGSADGLTHDGQDAAAPLFSNSSFDARDVAPDPDAAVPTPVCAEVEATPERIIPALTLLIDGSGSMRCAYPEPADCDCDAQLRGTCVASAGTSRWQALASALFGPSAASAAPGAAPGVVTRLDRVVRFGMVLYHDPLDASACPTLPVDLPLDLERGQLLADSFPDEPPGANTPTARALRHVLQGLPASTDDAPQHVLLATDGEPFVCFDPSTPLARDYAAVEAQAALARAAGVVLHVLSLAPASGDFAKHLDSVAGLGGTARALLPADGDALVTELELLVTSAIACEVELDGTVSEGLRCDGSVTLAGDALECGSVDGYRMVSASRMELLGAACDAFRHDPDAALSVTFPCDTFTPK